MRFYLNENLLYPFSEVLENRKNIYWIVGGSCSGKSTVGKAIASKYGMLYYDMDELIFSKYIERYSKELHPANWTWFSANNPLEFALSFSSWEENNEFNIAATAEQINIFCEDIQAIDKSQAILVDGGLTNPAVLAKIMDSDKIFCIKIEDALCIKIWESCEERQPMKEMILQLPSPQDQWDKFLKTNLLMNQQMEAECRESKIRIFYRQDTTTVDEMVNKISAIFV